MNIGLFQHSHAMFGGSVYEKKLSDVLSSQHTVTQFEIRNLPFNTGVRPQVFLAILLKQMAPKIDLWIRGNIAVAAMTNRSVKRRNVALLHHIDTSEIGNYWINRGLARLFLRNARKCDCVVVVAEFWKEYLESEGIERVVVIPNAFDTEAFAVKEEQVYNFKKKNSLLDKPVIYIGNCQESKGSAEVYKTLKSMDVHLVSSGVRKINLPVRAFELSYPEYVLLLSACDVVITMSKFLEGWNRVAHEAMLCKTPVIGSGSGGMGELLEGGGQITCKNIEDLRDHVHFALANAAPLGERGYRFASQFTLQRFAESWLRLIESIRDTH
jgi:glycosyltransferase involved in cell wall biosynthesis